MVKTKPFASRIGKILIIILVIAVLLGILFYSIYLYSYIESSRVNDLEVTKTKVIQSGQLTEVTEMYHFQDKEAYHILIGLDKDKKSKIDRKSTRLNSSHVAISYAVFCLKKKR